MNNKITYFIFLILLLNGGCGETTKSIPQPYIIPNGIMQDSIKEKNYGKTIPSFIDLKEMSLNIDDDSIQVRMMMLSLPDNLTYNRDTGEHNEYEWGVIFNSKDNIRIIAFIKGKNPKEGEKIGILSDIVEVAIYVNNLKINSDNIDINIEENNIIINVLKFEYLNQITTSTEVGFRTLYQYKNTSSIKNFDTYPNLPDITTL